MDRPFTAAPRVPLRAIAAIVALCTCAVVGWRAWSVRQAGPAAETAQRPPIASVSQAPAKPSPGSVATNDAAGAPTFDIVRVSPDGGLVVAGQAEPGSTVTVKRGDTLIAQVQADPRGAWVAVPPDRLEPGSGELTLSSRGADGHVRTASATAVIVVPEPSGAAPPRTSAPPLAVLSMPAEPSLLLQPPPPQGSPVGKLGVATVDYDDSGAIRFSGTAPYGGTIRIYVDNHATGDATADTSGRWTLSPQSPVTPGLHRLRVDQLSENGRVVNRVEVPFERETLALSQVRPGQVVVQPGQNLWRLARRVYGTGLRYTVIYAANRGQIRDVRRIYPGQVFSVPALKS